MKKSFITLCFLFCLGLISISSCGEENLPLSTEASEVVFFNGKIYTVNAAQPWAEALYMKDGVIKFVGSSSDAQAAAPADVKQINLNGAFMMPGIHDVHMHPLEASTKNFKFTLDENEDDAEKYGDVISDANKKNSGSGWLLGFGHVLETILKSKRAPKLIIDDVVSDRPVGIMESTSHSLWCNSKALELLGYTSNSPNPQGGIIMKDANGEPNGILIDNAGELLMELALAPTKEGADNDYKGLIEFGLPELAKNGITSFCEARTFYKRNQQDTWKRVEAEGKLTVRAILDLWAYPAEDDVTQLAKLKSLYSNNPNSLLRINQIKVYSDGIIHNSTAAMKSNYFVNYFNLTTNNGLNYFTESRLTQYIRELEPTGFDFHIHTLGNRAVHEALNAIQNGGSNNGRHRLTHVEYIDAVDIPRFAQLNATADAQVAGDFTKPDHWHENDYLVGPALTGNIIPIKSLVAANARLTLSSDWDVSTLNPFVGLQNAITRSPQEISLENAVKAYTINAAYVMRQENKVGTLEVGKEADLIILDRNIFAIPANEINQTKVTKTYVRGKIVHE